MLFKGLNPIEQLQLVVSDFAFGLECNKIARVNRKAGFIHDEPAAPKQSHDTTPSKKSQPKSTIKTSEEEKQRRRELIRQFKESKRAEAEAPVEPAGAENVTKRSDAKPQYKPQVEASMAGTATPEQKVNVSFDFAAMNGEQVQPNLVGQPSANPNVGPQGQLIYQQPSQPQQIPPEFIQNPMLYYQYLQRQQMMGQQPSAPPGAGRHKVDNPPAPKVPVQKAEADNVQMDGLNMVHAADVVPPPPPKQWPVAVSTPLANPVPEQAQPIEAKFDNKDIARKYKYIGEIEKIALDSGHQVQFIMRAGPDGNPDGLITVVTYLNGNPHPIPQMGFTIDTGMIIDKRPKMFPVVVPYGFENYPCYQINIPDPNKKDKFMFNSSVFEDLFKGGVQMLEKHRTMYTDNFRILNTHVAMITMPTQHMNRDTRKAVQNRLMKAMEAGVFDQAKKDDPASRFIFTSYDKKTGSFVLSNVGVPVAYDGPVCSSIPIEIHFMPDNQTKIVKPKEV